MHKETENNADIKKSEWTEEEKQYLIDNRNLSVKTQAEQLNRTMDAVYKMRHTLEISDRKVEKTGIMFKEPVKVVLTENKELVIAIKKEMLHLVDICFEGE